MSTKATFSPKTTSQPSGGSDEIFYQEAWSKVKLIKPRRRIAELEIERDRNRSERKQIQADLQSYKAAYTMVTRALQEEQEPRLRLLKALRNPASEFVVQTLTNSNQIGLVAAAVTIERLNVVTELVRLGFLSLKGELFAPTEAGKELIRKLGSVEDNASSTPA